MDDCGTVSWSHDYVDGNMSDDCGATGSVDVTFTATDDCMNASTLTLTFTIKDEVAPTLNASGAVDVPCETYSATGIYEATASDLCGSATVELVSVGNTSSTCPQYLHRYRAVDDCGNASAIFEQIVSLVDEEDPEVEITCPARKANVSPSSPPKSVKMGFDFRIQPVQGQLLSANHSPAFRATATYPSSAAMTTAMGKRGSHATATGIPMIEMARATAPRSQTGTSRRLPAKPTMAARPGARRAVSAIAFTFSPAKAKKPAAATAVDALADQPTEYVSPEMYMEANFPASSMTSSIRRAQLGEVEACQTGIMSKLLGLHEQVPIALSRVQFKLLQVLILFEDAGNDLTVAFNKWDINGDGSLEGVELWRGLSKMGGYFETIPVEEIEDLVLKLDLDGNGTIEAEEICEFVRMGRNTLAVQPLRRALERGLLVPQDRPSKVCWSGLRAGRGPTGEPAASRAVDARLGRARAQEQEGQGEGREGQEEGRQGR